MLTFKTEPRFPYLFYLSLYGWLLLALVSCQPGSRPQVTPTGTTPIAQTGVMTVVRPTLTTTQPPPTPSRTVLLTASPRPTRQPGPTPNVASSPEVMAVGDLHNFLLYETSDDEIYLFRPDGSVTFVTRGYLLDGQPWSPDDTKIVLRSPSTNGQESPGKLKIADLTTGQTSIIELPVLPGAIFWSPDGRYLLYRLPVDELVEGASYRDTRLQARLALYDLTTKTNRLLTKTSVITAIAGWSPDSQKIAFVSNMNGRVDVSNQDLTVYTYGQFDVYILDVANSKLQQITDTPDIETIASWSPTDNLLLVGAWPVEESWPSPDFILEFPPWDAADLYLMDSSGMVLATLDGAVSIAWSPDGKKLAFTNSQICVMEVTTLALSCMASNDLAVGPNGRYLSWSADGNRLAFVAQDFEKEQQCYRVYVVNLTTREGAPVAETNCYLGSVLWSRALP